MPLAFLRLSMTRPRFVPLPNSPVSRPSRWSTLTKRSQSGGGLLVPGDQPNESSKILSAQWNICCTPSEVGRAASAKDASTRFMALVPGSYWNESVSYAAVVAVIGLKQAELVTGLGSGASPLKARMIPSAQTLACELAM